MNEERGLSEFSRKELRDYISSAPKSGHPGYKEAVEKLSELDEELLYELLTSREKKFIEAYTDNGGNATRAAEAAGYSATNKASLSAQGSRTLKSVKVAAYLRACVRDECSKLGLTREKMLLDLNDLRVRARKGNNYKAELGAISAMIKMMGFEAPEQTDQTVTVIMGGDAKKYAE